MRIQQSTCNLGFIPFRLLYHLRFISSYLGVLPVSGVTYKLISVDLYYKIAVHSSGEEQLIFQLSNLLVFKRVLRFLSCSGAGGGGGEGALLCLKLG